MIPTPMKTWRILCRDHRGKRGESMRKNKYWMMGEVKIPEEKRDELNSLILDFFVFQWNQKNKRDNPRRKNFDSVR